MSELLKKASSNYDAAEMLIEKGNYPPSIHCAYYSCLQIILFLINSKLANAWQSYQDGLDAAKALNKEKTESLHNQYITFIKEDIKKTDRTQQRLFSAGIGVLKKYRNDSDYKEKEIPDDIAGESFDLATKIHLQLYKHYNLV
jgi:uncharacterized protein (UPF0332 family)